MRNPGSTVLSQQTSCLSSPAGLSSSTLPRVTGGFPVSIRSCTNVLYIIGRMPVLTRPSLAQSSTFSILQRGNAPAIGIVSTLTRLQVYYADQQQPFLAFVFSNAVVSASYDVQSMLTRRRHTTCDTPCLFRKPVEVLRSVEHKDPRPR
ncbi:hypothetical protein ACJQWK_02256 [Exserohilum turcicum]